MGGDFCELGSGLGCACSDPGQVDPQSIGDVLDFLSDAADWAGDAVKDVADVVTSIPVLGSLVKGAYDLTGIGIVLDVAQGKPVADSLVNGFKDGANGVKTFAQYGSMVASFVPGVGTGVAAALSAATALAQGKSITDAVYAGVRGALPGGAIAVAAFDVGVSLASGKTWQASALEAIRGTVPGGVIGQKAFDVAVALTVGKKMQQQAVSSPDPQIRAAFLDCLAFKGPGPNLNINPVTGKPCNELAYDLAQQGLLRKYYANPIPTSAGSYQLPPEIMATLPPDPQPPARRRPDALYAGESIDVRFPADLLSPSGQWRYAVAKNGGWIENNPGTPLAKTYFGGRDDSLKIAHADMQTDGNFVIYLEGGQPIWSTGTQGNPGAYLQMHNNGSLVVHAPNGSVLWESGYVGPNYANRVEPGFALIPGEGNWVSASQTDRRSHIYNIDAASGGESNWHYVVSQHGAFVVNDGTWTNSFGGEDPNLSVGIALMKADGNFVVFDTSWSPIWQTGTSGHPGAWLEIGTDGGLSIVEPSGAVVWRAGMSPPAPPPPASATPKPAAAITKKPKPWTTGKKWGAGALGVASLIVLGKSMLR